MNAILKNLPKTELKLPEYGRNIQHMVQHACTIEDRAERTRCARTIIDVMGNMFPYLRDVEDFKHKLWDHLYIMSDYKLDIDYPFEVKKPEQMPKPEKLAYNTQHITYRHYGRWIESLITKASRIPADEHRTELIRLIANNMKKSYIIWNKELADDTKIFDDLRELSNGAIDVKAEDMPLVVRNNGANHYNNRNQKNQKNNQRRY